jgi:hypothetical protein
VQSKVSIRYAHVQNVSLAPNLTSRGAWNFGGLPGSPSVIGDPKSGFGVGARHLGPLVVTQCRFAIEEVEDIAERRQVNGAAEWHTIRRLKIDVAHDGRAGREAVDRLETCGACSLRDPRNAAVERTGVVLLGLVRMYSTDSIVGRKRARGETIGHARSSGRSSQSFMT